MTRRIGMTPMRLPVIHRTPSSSYLAWGRNIDGDHTGESDNYKVKVMNSRIQLPQMASDGNRPIYFGASQVPHALSSSYVFAH
jgi:hypothetical protein